MYNINKLISPQVFEVLLKLLPTPKQRDRGRKRCSKRSLVSGIIQILVLWIPWRKMFPCGASSSSCYRYFCELKRRGILRKKFTLVNKGKTDITECAIDSNSIGSYRFDLGTGFDGKHKKYATKLSLLTDKTGLPVDAVFGKGNIHDLNFIPHHLKNTCFRRKKILNLDMGYTSKELRRKMKIKGIFVNMKTKKNDYIRKTGPKFKLKVDKYKVRFLVEKTFAWIENFKRCKFRLDYTLSSFKSWVYLALIIILIRG